MLIPPKKRIETPGYEPFADKVGDYLRDMIPGAIGLDVILPKRWKPKDEAESEEAYDPGAPVSFKDIARKRRW